MKVKVQDLKPGMFVCHSSGKGVLQIAEVVPMTIELYPQQHMLTFEGISKPEQVGEDTEFEVLGL